MLPGEPCEPQNSLIAVSELKFLRPKIIAVIEEALNKVGPFGEVQLVVEKGHLRYIRTIKSEPIDRTKS